MSANRRARTHERVAEALEELTAGRVGDRVGELAYHWANATRPSDSTKAVDYAAAAGRGALASLAPADAVKWFTQALDLLGVDGDPHRRAELLLGLGDAQLQTGDAAHRDTLLEAAHLAGATDDVELLATAALTNSRGWQSTIGRSDEERLAVIEAALDRLGDGHPATRGRLLALAAIEQIYTKPLDERLRFAEEAIRLSRFSNDVRAAATVPSLASVATVSPWTLSLRLGWIHEAVEAAEALGDPVVLCDGFNQHRNYCLEAADRDRLDELTGLIDTLVERVPNASVRWSISFARVMLALLDGDIDRGEQLATEALELGLETGQPDAFTIYSAQFANLSECRGRFGELVSLVEKVVRDNPGLPVFRAALAQSLADAGELERCQELFDQDRDNDFPVGEDSSWANAHMNWAKAAIALGDSEAAEIRSLRRTRRFPPSLVTTSADWSTTSADSMTPTHRSPGPTSCTDDCEHRSSSPAPRSAGRRCSSTATTPATPTGLGNSPNRPATPPPDDPAGTGSKATPTPSSSGSPESTRRTRHPTGTAASTTNALQSARAYSARTRSECLKGPTTHRGRDSGGFVKAGR